jgi:hypothetical protein
MRLILAKIIWNFDITLAPGSEKWPEQKCFVLWSKGPLFVRMVPSQMGRDTVLVKTASEAG